jgi:hypothetical protein
MQLWQHPGLQLRLSDTELPAAEVVELVGFGAAVLATPP